MLDFLFDPPWYLPTVPIIVGIIVTFVGLKRIEKPVVRGGLGILLAGMLIGLVGYLVDTDQEKAIGRTHALVAAAGARDWARFQSLIDPQTTVYSLKGPAEITDAARQVIERFDVKSVRVTGTNARQIRTTILVEVRVYSDQRGRAGMTDWRMEFQNLGSGWILFSVTAISNEIITDERIRSAIERL